MLLNRNDGNKWRMMKAMAKRLCDGKKKETDYSQQPQFTKWEFDRGYARYIDRIKTAYSGVVSSWAPVPVEWHSQSISSSLFFASRS